MGRLAALQVAQDAEAALVALFGGLGHELVHQRRQHRRYRRHPLDQRGCAHRQVRMHQLQRILGAERRLAREHLVEGHAQRIEVAAVVLMPPGPPALFRGEIGQRALQAAVAALDGAKGRGDAQIGELRLPVVQLQTMLRGLRSLWAMRSRCSRARARTMASAQSKKSSSASGPAASNSARIATTDVFEHQHLATLVFQQFQGGAHRPAGTGAAGQFVFVAQPGLGLGRGIVGGQLLEDHRWPSTRRVPR